MIEATWYAKKVYSQSKALDFLASVFYFCLIELLDHLPILLFQNRFYTATQKAKQDSLMCRLCRLSISVLFFSILFHFVVFFSLFKQLSLNFFARNLRFLVQCRVRFLRFSAPPRPKQIFFRTRVFF